MKIILDDWIIHRGGTDKQEKATILAQVRLFFKQKDGKTYLYVFPEVFRQEICQGFEPKQVIKYCIQADFLLLGMGNRTAQLVKLPHTQKNCRAYCFSEAVIGIFNENNS